MKSRSVYGIAPFDPMLMIKDAIDNKTPLSVVMVNPKNSVRLEITVEEKPAPMVEMDMSGL